MWRIWCCSCCRRLAPISPASRSASAAMWRPCEAIQSSEDGSAQSCAPDREEEKNMKIEVLVDVKTTLGEGPLWDVDEQRLYFIDSFGCNVFRCTADGREVRAWDVPAKIGSMALRRQGGAVVSLANGVHFFDFKSGDCQLIVDPEPDKPANRL